MKMRVAMVFPTRESEKAISGYSIYLVKALNKNKVDSDSITYTAGSPMTLFKNFKYFKKYDIIHIQHEYNLLGWYSLPFFILYPLLSLSGCKVITTMHTTLSQKEKLKGNVIKTFLRRLLYFIQNRVINWFSDIVIVHAYFFKDILSKEYGFSKGKIKVLPQGIIEDTKVIPQKEAKKKIRISGNAYLIIGNFVPDHGADIILKQAGKIGKTILIVANPKAINDRNQKRLTNYLDSCIKYVRDKGFSKYVRFDTKPINDEKPLWWNYFAAADLVLQPYRGGIGSGIFTHAMSTKTPVVASNIKFFEEISERYGCIKVADKEEDYPKIIKEVMKPKNYAKMKKECVRYAKENSWNEVAKKYKKIYSTLN